MTETNLPSRPITAAAFDEFLSEHLLMASSCLACGLQFLPPRAICPRCFADDLVWIPTSGRGKLVGFSVIYVAPSFMIAQGFSREKPYVSGIVELEEGLKISARITGVDPAHPDTIQVGMPLEVDFVEFGEGDQKKTFLAFKKV